MKSFLDKTALIEKLKEDNRQKINIDDVLSSVDLVSIVSETGVRLKKIGLNRWRCSCPIHGGKNHTGFSLYVKDGVQMWKCFTGSCGGGNVVSFVMKYKNMSFKDALMYLVGDNSGKFIPTEEDELNFFMKKLERISKNVAEEIEEEKNEKITFEKFTKNESWVKYHSEDVETRTELWKSRGVSEDMQKFWMLGYCSSKPYSVEGNFYRSPSLAIPMFDYGRVVLNVKHRLLNPVNSDDKYRPDAKNIRMPLFIANPDISVFDVENVIFVEGEIKAMVVYQFIDNSKWQVVGIPGKKANRVMGEVAKTYKGKNCIVCLDPDARGVAEILSKAVSGKLMLLNGKIDDMILSGEMNKEILKLEIRKARKL